MPGSSKSRNHQFHAHLVSDYLCPMSHRDIPAGTRMMAILTKVDVESCYCSECEQDIYVDQYTYMCHEGRFRCASCNALAPTAGEAARMHGWLKLTYGPYRGHPTKDWVCSLACYGNLKPEHY